MYIYIAAFIHVSTGCSSEYMLHRCSNIEDDRVDFCGLFCLHAVCVKPKQI